MCFQEYRRLSAVEPYPNFLKELLKGCLRIFFSISLQSILSLLILNTEEQKQEVI